MCKNVYGVCQASNDDDERDTLTGDDGEIYLEPDATPDTGDVGTVTNNPE
jgi:hypothetical protein